MVSCQTRKPVAIFFAVFLPSMHPINAKRTVDDMQMMEPSPTSFSELNQSRTGKKLLWQSILTYAGRREIDHEPKSSIKFFDDKEVQGTLGLQQKILHWEKISDEEISASTISTLHLPLLGDSGMMISFNDAYVLDKWLVLQGESSKGCCDYLNISSLESLHRFIAPNPNTLADVKLTFRTRRWRGIASIPKWGLWYGRLVKPLSVTEHDPITLRRMPFTQDYAWDLACPAHVDPRYSTQSEPRKMVIPLEYASYNAYKENYEFNGRPGDPPTEEPIEMIWDMDRFDPHYIRPDAVLQLGRLVGYRTGLLYVKYLCQDKKIQVQKISLMLRFEKESPYEVWDPTEATTKKDIDISAFARPFTKSV